MSAKPATVAFHSSKNCFVNLPRSWTLKISREKVAVFEVQGPDGSLFTSWAGGATVPSTAGLETIEINGLFSSKQNISHGDEVVVCPLPSAPPCTQVFVEPVSITDWEILEQHAAFIEGNLLNQVRAVWLGQVISIWVQKNICIFIKIGKTVPSSRCCVLEQNTEVIVAPKARNAQPTKSVRPSATGDNKRNTNGTSIDTTRLSTDTIADEQQRKPRVRNMSGNKFVEGLKQAAESYNKPRSRGNSDAGLNGTVPSIDPAIHPGATTLDPQETESEIMNPGMLGRFVNYWKSWWHGPKQSKQVPEDETLQQAVYESEILKDGFDCLLRVQSLDAICDCGDTPSVDDTMVKEVVSSGSELRLPHLGMSEILLKQPTTVFIKPHTYLHHNTNSDVRILSPPKPFLAVLHKMLSPVEKEEIQTKKSREQSSANLPSQSASGKPDKTSTGTVLDQLDDSNQSNGKSPRKVVVRVVITNWSHKLAGGFMRTKSQLKQIGAEHIAIADTLRSSLGYESTGHIRLTAISHVASTVKQITLHPLSAPPKGFTKDMLLTAVMTWFEITSPVTCPLVVNQGTVLQIPLKPDLCGYFLITFQQNKSTTSASSDPSTYVLLTPEVLARVTWTMADQVPSSGLPLPLAGLASGRGGDIDLSVPRTRLGQLGGVSTLSEKAIRHINLSLAQNPLSRTLFRHSPGVATGGLLLCGGKGIGKSVIGRGLCRKASEWPNMAYVTTLDCKALRGKRIENMRKVLEQVFQEAAWRQPSVLLLDDLDRVAAAPAGPEHEMSGEALYYARVAEVLKDIMDAEIENGSKVVVMATSRSRSSIHPSLVASRGKHYFTEILDIPPPSETSRVDILKAIIINKPAVSPACITDLDLEALSTRTEGYVAKDLEMVVDRAIHAHRMVTPPPNNEEMLLCSRDLDVAMKGFTPAALRNVSLHKGEELGWVDVGGLRDIRDTLVETLQWPTKYPKLFASCPLRLRSGLLLYGAPGTGKTLLAGVLAKECGLNFISIKGPELLSKYIGASEQSVRDTFLRAQSAKPCILFFDEFDSLAPRRGHDSTGVTDRVVNQFLTQLDGVEGLQGVYVLAATSRPDLIDPALLRPGRLDKALLCPLPDESERQEILQALTRNMTLDPDVDLTYLAESCDHFTGADFKALLYNAQLEAIHEATGLTDNSEGILEISPSGTVLKQEDNEFEREPITGGNEEQTVQLEEGQNVESAELTDIEHSLNEKPGVSIEIGGSASVVEKSLPAKRVTYIPSLEQGKVELSPDRETQYLQQYEETMSPSGGEDKKQSMATVIRQQHLVTALSDMGPSVSAAERRKYAKIYETFVASRGGNFTEPVPPSGKKATLA